MKRPIRPMLLIRRPGLDPPREQLLLLGRERLLRMRRGHDHVGIGGVDPGNQFALRQVAGDDRPRAAFEFAGRLLGGVEPQARLLLPRPMAGVAVFGEERPDVAVKPQRRRLGRLGRRGSRSRRPQHRRTGEQHRGADGPHPHCNSSRFTCSSGNERRGPTTALLRILARPPLNPYFAAFFTF